METVWRTDANHVQFGMGLEHRLMIAVVRNIALDTAVLFRPHIRDGHEGKSFLSADHLHVPFTDVARTDDAKVYTLHAAKLGLPGLTAGDHFESSYDSKTIKKSEKPPSICPD